MKLVKRFMLKDIREYEEDNNVNILDYFNNAFDLNNLIELIKIGNKIEEKEACELLDKYLEDTNNDIVKAYREIRDVLLGKQPDEQTDNIETKQYDSLTDIFNELCKQILSLGISYSEFWSMSTREMYSVVEGLQDKQINDFNNKQDEMYMQAVLNAQAVWGKIKQPNHIEIDDPNAKVYTEEFGEITKAEYDTIKALGGFKKEG